MAEMKPLSVTIEFPEKVKQEMERFADELAERHALKLEKRVRQIVYNTMRERETRRM